MRIGASKWSLAIGVVLALMLPTLTASAITYYVDASVSSSGSGGSWSSPKKTIQEALTLFSVDEIRCADGIYKPTSQTTSINLMNGVRIKGGYIGPNSESIDPNTRDPNVYTSILSGDIDGDDDPDDPFDPDLIDDNAYHVVYADHTVAPPTGLPVSETVNLDGFFVTGGHALGTFYDALGGGILIGTSQPVIRACTFKSCSAVRGGAIMCLETVDPPVIRNCTFIANRAVGSHGGKGGGIDSNHSVTVINSVFYQNHADDWGGAVSIEDVYEQADLKVINCTFIDNDCARYGGAIYMSGEDNPDPVLSNCHISNCVFDQNRGTSTADSDGGAIWIGAVVVDMSNCTLYNNSVAFGCGGALAYYRGGTGPITNCIFYGNTSGSSCSGASDIQTSVATPSVSYCALQQQGYSGNGNVNLGSQSPLFGDPNGIDNEPATLDDNFRLQSGSPCRNAGLDSAAPEDGDNVDEDSNLTEKLDLDRLIRILGPDLDGTDVDMCAYEHRSSSTCCADINGTGCINIDDLLLVINGWARPGVADVAAAAGCAGDGTVNIDDLLMIVNAWGNCPGHTCNEGSFPQSVDDCMDDASELYEAFSEPWLAHTNACIETLCKLGTIECD